MVGRGRKLRVPQVYGRCLHEITQHIIRKQTFHFRISEVVIIEVICPLKILQAPRESATAVALEGTRVLIFGGGCEGYVESSR